MFRHHVGQACHIECRHERFADLGGEFEGAAFRAHPPAGLSPLGGFAD